MLDFVICRTQPVPLSLEFMVKEVIPMINNNNWPKANKVYEIETYVSETEFILKDIGITSNGSQVAFDYRDFIPFNHSLN